MGVTERGLIIPKLRSKNSWSWLQQSDIDLLVPSTHRAHARRGGVHSIESLALAFEVVSVEQHLINRRQGHEAKEPSLEDHLSAKLPPQLPLRHSSAG